MFSVEERGRVRERLLELADADPRIVAGAEIGALAHQEPSLAPPKQADAAALLTGVVDDCGDRFLKGRAAA
jgi:hypothetical protein